MVCVSCLAWGESSLHEETTVANGEADMAQRVDARASLALRSARPVVVGLLLLIAIAGIGAASPAATGHGPWQHHAVAIGIALEAVLASLEIALLAMSRRAAAASHPARALRSALSWAAAVIMVLIVVIAVANVAAHRRGGLLQHFLIHRSKPRKGGTLPAAPHSGTVAHASYLPYALAGLIVLVALIACVVLVARARTRLRRVGGYVDESPADERDELRQALDSGRAALRAVGDARAAIIACYVAMEQSLASAGAARAAGGDTRRTARQGGGGRCHPRAGRGFADGPVL